MPKLLESFVITRSADGYLLQIEDEDGGTLELGADIDQLELLADEVDRRLEEDEEALELDEEEADNLMPS